MPISVKSILNDSQIQLEKAASDKFGAAIEQFGKGAVGALGKPDANNPTAKTNRNDGSWYATSYAAALAGPTSFRPKTKFLFKVEFGFSQKALAILGDDITKNRDFAFMVKTIDRPKITFEYEEDVNMYNFRTKVLKRIQHRELTVAFVDDVGNRVFDFFRYVMAILSPITVRGLKRDNTIANPSAAENDWKTSSSMNFGSKPLAQTTIADAQNNTSHRAAVNSKFGQVFDYIRIKQFFVNPSADLNSATRMVAYDFINPRVTNFDFDELSHEANDVSTLTMVFDFDWMEMVDIGTVGTKNVSRSAALSLGRDTPQVIPGYYGAPTQATSTTETGGSASGPAGGNKGVIGALGTILDRSVDTMTKDAISKAVKSVAGNGRFANILATSASSGLGSLGNAGISAGMDKLGSIFSKASSPNGAAPSGVARSEVGGGEVTAVVRSTDAEG